MTFSSRESVHRPRSTIGHRLRRDIVWQLHNDSQSTHPTWIAKDPLTRRIFRCGEAEYRMLHWLDHESSFESMQDGFNKTFAPQTIEMDQIRTLIAKCNHSGILRPIPSTSNPSLQRSGILQPPVDNKTGRFKSSRSIASKSAGANWLLLLIRWLASAIGKLAQMQVSLGSPDRWLGGIGSRLGWIYSGTAVCFWLGLFGISFLLIGMRFDEFWLELPNFQSIRSASVLVGYGVLFVLTRFIHEFGHAVACKRAGASCRDAGLIVSFGMVCPYVDITDASRVASKMQRMGIALAGIYTECILAFLSAVLWLATHPGWIHDVALQTLLVCTVTTLLFNANPLMKYDGYFVLCDWLNTQNLRERSFEALDSMLDRRSTRGSLGMSIFLSIYFFASTLNRIVLIAGVATMVYFIASEWQLAGVGIALIVLYGCCSSITTMAAWTMSLDGGARTKLTGRRVAWLGWTAVSLLIAWAVNMPLPSRTYTIGTFFLGERQPVYASLPGRLESIIDAQSGANIEVNSVIAKLSNESIRKKVYELEIRLMRIDHQLEALERMAYFDERSPATLPMLVAQRELVSKQLEQKTEEQSHLSMLAPVSGWFEPAASKPVESLENPSEFALRTTTGTSGSMVPYWISDVSVGRFVDRGTLVGWMVQDLGPTIECHLTEEQISGITTKSLVRVCLSQDPTAVLAGKVVEMAKTSHANPSPSKMPNESSDVSGMCYQVRIKLDEDRDWSLYASGNAEVVFIRPSQSLFHIAMDRWMRDSKMR